MHILCSAALAAFCLAFSATASAQCTPVANTGCPGAGTILCGAQPRIGAPVRFRCPTGSGGLQLLLIGGCATAPLPIGPPACANPCGLGVDPAGVGVLPSMPPATVVNVPNAPALQGLTFCIQCADFDPVRNCLDLSEASSFVLM